MHVLRCTVYSHPEHSMSVIVREVDVMSFSEALAGCPADHFMVHEVFEMEEADITTATVAAMQRRTPERELRERNMALSFFWHAHYLALLHDGGVVSNTEVSPLSADEIRQVFMQLREHPDYKPNQSVVSFAEDGTPVTLSGGTVTIQGKQTGV